MSRDRWSEALRTLARRHGWTPELQAELLDLVEAPTTPDSEGLKTELRSMLPTGVPRLSVPTSSTGSGSAPGAGHADLTFPPDASTDEVEALQSAEEVARYEDLGPLGRGGIAEVRRVHDRDLNRVVAMKILDEARQEAPAALARFVEEAQLTAQLEHPGIVPVHDLGRLPDGRLFFTMQEIRGQTLSGWVRELHRSEAPQLRPAVGLFASVCDAVAYAHDRGVVHRDLKPSNIMIGEYGAVRVVDWGLAALLTPRPRGRRSALGTPAYMPPEQARGELEQIGPRSDVWALGATLLEVLTGRTPWTGHGKKDILRRLARSERPPWPGGPRAPDALRELVDAALQPDPQARPADAAEVVERVRAWLHGVARREKGRAMVEAARALRPEAEGLRERAATLRAEAEAMLEAVALTAPVADKREAWSLQDEAVRLVREARLRDAEHLQGLRGALTVAPDLREAHDALADWYRDRHSDAEARGDLDEAAHLEVFVRDHDRSGRHRAYLRGDGTLTLTADAPEATARLFRIETRDRRRVPVPDRDLGRLPLREVPLGRGSWLVLVRAPGRVPVRVPVFVERGEDWAMVPPGASEAVPVYLPAALPDDEALVSAGWFLAGGDDEVPCLPRQRLWVDGFVIQRHPVDNAAYIRFLDALVDAGRDDEALRHVPRERAGTAGELGPMIFGRDDDGHFVLRPDADGDVWFPDAPVLMVDWHGAMAYAAWLCAHTGQRWRLPLEYEWEKAARGVDGRAWPMGDHADPTWLCIRTSHTGDAAPPRRDDFPLDVSVYGVRGMAGGVRDWCLDLGDEQGAPTPGGRVVVPDAPGSVDAARVYRGGDWYGLAVHARAAYRAWNKPRTRNYSLGFRLVRSV